MSTVAVLAHLYKNDGDGKLIQGIDIFDSDIDRDGDGDGDGVM